ncbi:hypothetical protein H1R20_g6387, partial [Candolleomyces eurysporus]
MANNLLGPQQQEILSNIHQAHDADQKDFGAGVDIKEVPATVSDIMSLRDVADTVMEAIKDQYVPSLVLDCI